VKTGAPALSVIVVSWNVRDLLRDCLLALPAATAGLVAEVIVVDNASDDGSAEMVEAAFPRVMLLRNDANVGFARANNRGMAAARGRHLVLLNSDTVAHPNSITDMVRFLDERPRAGAASPRLLRPDGTPQPYAFGDDPTPRYLLRRALAHKRRRHLHDWDAGEPIEAGWVSGACLVARREAVEQVGGLDERIFMYFEDNDWCRRMRLRGWEVWYNPRAEITHIGGAGLNQNPRARAAYYESLAYFYRKHYGPIAGAIMRLLVGVRNQVSSRNLVSRSHQAR
jgi:GT2 family glycosyltransferase